MKRLHRALPVCLALLALPLAAQETPAAMTQAYESLADTVLAVRAAEHDLVGAILDGHRHAATVLAQKGDWEGAAAQVALFANEGDNGVGGVRKRLLEGGHHFNASGEEAGMYEPGFVIVTREAKATLLADAAALRQDDEMARQKAWDGFLATAEELLGH